MLNIRQAVEYPRNDDDWLKTVIVGGVLVFFSFLLVPMVLVYGYLVRVIRETLDGDARPPAFEEWGELLGDGVQALVVGLVYMLVPLVVAGVTVGGAVVSFLADPGSGLAVAQLFVGLALTAVLSLVFGYVAVVAVVNFARVGELSAGFAFGDIKPVLLSRAYAVSWLLSVVVVVLAGIVTGILNAIPVLGTLVGAFITFYALVVAARLWADGFADARRGQDVRSQADLGEQTI